MAELVRFGISMEESLAEKFDRLVERRGYQNRSEAVRDLVRRELIHEDWQDPRAEIVGTLTLLYDHHVHEIEDRLVDLQHKHYGMVISTMHVHLTAGHCLEVLVVRGQARQVRKLADQLIAARGVLHGELVASAGGAILKKGH